MNTISDDLVAKIQKLLRVSTSANEHEAGLAMAHAQKLCTRHNIDISSIQAFEPSKGEEPVVKSDEVSLGKRLPIAEKYVVHIVQDFFNIKIIYHGGRHFGRRVTFVGKKPDIEIAQYIYNYLNHTFLQLWRDYYNENDTIRLEERGSYFYGLQQGLTEKLKQSRVEAETERFEEIRREQNENAANEIKNQYGLMVVNQQKRLEDKMKEFYPRLGTMNRSYSSGYSRNAFNDGKAKGKTISVNRAIGTGSGGQLK